MWMRMCEIHTHISSSNNNTTSNMTLSTESFNIDKNEQDERKPK